MIRGEMDIDWDVDKKIDYRNIAVIDKYRSITGNQRLPIEKQYWTMCGKCARKDETGNYSIYENCELDQVLSSGLIRDRQFHGVEIDTDIFQINRLAANQVNWHNGDFWRVIRDASSKPWFNPGIVHIDHIRLPKDTALFAGTVMEILSDKDIRDVLLIISCLVKWGPVTSGTEDLVKYLKDTSSYQLSYPKGWEMHDEWYWYQGSGRGGSEMASFALWRS